MELGLKRLWTPWRMPYILSDKNSDACVFCQKLAQGPKHDRENYILFRGENAFVVLNIYPYNNGHLMVLPYEHVASLEMLAPEIQTEMMHLVSHFITLTREAMNPEGFNIGINIGKAAGAGIDDHIHIHIVPRWKGDTNFMPVVGQMRVIPEWLDDTYARLEALIKDHPPNV
jgi:ATP adenylyltransferase